MSPVEVERKLLELTGVLSKALANWKKIYNNHKKADHAYDQTVARVRIDVAREISDRNERKYHVDTHADVIAAREDAIFAETIFKYAEEELKGIHAAIRAWQSVGTSVRQAYATSGKEF